MNSVQCTFTRPDHSILVGMLVHRGTGPERIGTLLGMKLAKAVVVEPEEIEPDVITLGSRVLFCVNGGKPREQLLVIGSEPRLDGSDLPVWTVRGVSLIGMRAGESVSVPTSTVPEILTVEMVLFQPEADAY